MSQPNPSPEQHADAHARVYRLLGEWYQAKREKKEAARMHTENIKRIEEEITEIMREEAETPAPE